MTRIVLRLDEPREFVVHDASTHDPLRPDELDRAGVEVVLDRTQESWRDRGAPDVLVLAPPATWDPTLPGRMQAALDGPARRWAAGAGRRRLSAVAQATEGRAAGWVRGVLAR